MDDRLTARFNFMVTDAKNFLGDWDMCDPVVWAILRVVHAQNDLTYAIAADPSTSAERLTRYGEFGPGVKAEYWPMQSTQLPSTVPGTRVERVPVQTPTLTCPE